jgi:flagellar hook-associated protein 1
MSGLFGSLSSGVKALTAHSRSVETAGRNLSNVNNPNYARQRVVYGDRGTVQTPLGAQSLGIEAKSIQQLRDVLLDRQVVRETAIKYAFEAQQAAYQKAQAGLGQSIDRAGEVGSSGFAGNGSGIAESVGEFFNAFQSFAARPTDPGERQTLIQKAGILTDRIQITDTRLAQLQSDLTDQIGADLDDANRLLASIANLNAEIGRFEINQPGGAVDLRDQRQGVLEELAQKIGVESQADPSEPGQIQVFVRDGSGNPIILVNQASVTGNLTISGSTVSGGSPSTAIALNGGSIDGRIDARGGAIQTLRDDLDELANQLVVSVNGAYNPLGTTGNFFNSSNLTAATISLDSGLTATNLKASDGGPAGDNTIAQAVANLANRTFSIAGGDVIEGTFAQHFATAVSDLGQSLSSINLRVEDQSNIESLVRTQRDAVSGVSLDEELTDLVKYQRAFQASSRVIQVINELLENVVNMGRA